MVASVPLRMSSSIHRVLFALSVACLLAAIALRPVWYDEILGHWMATLAWPEDVRAATRAGVDLQPPGWYLLVRATESLTGSLSGPRLLGLAGVGAAAVLVGRLACERWGKDAGHFATAALLLTAARSYAGEGRPYGLLLGCAAVALFAWNRIAEGSRRTLWLSVLAVTLALAVQLHYFAVLLLFPLGVGELVRARARGRLDGPVLAALALPILPIVLLLPDARKAGERMSQGPFSAPGVSALESQYKGLLSMLLGVLVALLLVYVCQRGLARSRSAVRDFVRDPLQAAIVALLLLPAAAMLLVIAGGSGITHLRYALPFSLGASLAAAGLVHALVSDPRTRQRLAVCCALTALVLCGRDANFAYRARKEAALPILPDAHAGMVHVFPPTLDGLQVWQASDARARSEIRLAADPEMALAGGYKATADINLTGARGLLPFPVASWQDLRELDRPFVLIQRPNVRSWVLDALVREEASLEWTPAAKGWTAWIVGPKRSGNAPRSAEAPSAFPAAAPTTVVGQDAAVARPSAIGG